MRTSRLSPPLRALFPILALMVFLAVLLIGSRSRPPVVESIYPSIGHGGDVLIISGKDFGIRRHGSQVLVADVSPTSTSYLEWRDDSISVRIPEEVRSGFVYVVVGDNRSNGILFANSHQLPVVLAGPTEPGQPLISHINRPRASVGELLLITGKNFGVHRGTSAVLFTWLSGDPLSQNAGKVGFIAADVYDFDYEAWSDTEIQVRVPDGAVTGNVLVRTDKGNSNEVFFEISSSVGSKRYIKRRTYSVKTDLSVANIHATRPNDLYLWVPKIWQSPAQRDVQLLAQEPEVLYDDVAGVSVYHIGDLVPGGVYGVSQQLIFERYAIETSVIGRRVLAYEQNTRLFQAFTRADALIPADDEEVIATALSFTKGEKNPWYRARKLYVGLQSRLSFDEKGALNPIVALHEGLGSAYDFAILYAALLRAVGVPSRPIGGYLVVSPDELHAHYWTEFYLYKFGWVPVDPTLGAGVMIGTMEPINDPAEYYFGSIDNRHLALSKGTISTGRIDPQGRTVRRSHLGTLQLHHEEAVGNLVSYSARWDGLSIVGMY